WPLSSPDYTATPTTTAANGLPIAQLPLHQTADLPLQNLASIPATGDLTLRLHVDGGQPSSENGAFFNAADNTNLPPPQLILTYTTSSTVAPSNSAVPVITGTAAVGQQLSASTGSWNGTAPLTYSYRWQRCDSSGCVDVGSNAATYTPTSADAGATIRVIVTATNSAGSASATSTPTAAVTAAATTITVNARPGDDGDVTVNNMAVPGAAYPPAGTPNPADKTQNLGVRRAFAFGGYE